MTTGGSDATRPFAGRRIVLGVTGGIAAFKAITAARRLTEAGAAVDVVLTAGALEFLQPLSFEAVTGGLAHTRAYEAGDPLLHIRLAKAADLVVVIPATANFIARAAGGFADDLLTSILLATRAPVLVCPAMNDAMYAHVQTQANLGRLTEIGYHIAGPDEGPLAWGEGEGPGRLVDPEVIVHHCARLLTPPGPLRGRHLLVTAGGTREPIDPVRFIGNRSSGRMGYALASAAWRRGARVTLVSGPSALETPTGVDLFSTETAGEMYAAVSAALPTADVLVMAAAVADYRVAEVADQKIKKDARRAVDIELTPTADILLETRHLRSADCVTVGFALETEDAVARGAAKLVAKDLDLLVVNDATEEGAGFDVSTNRVTLLDRAGGKTELPLMSKRDVAEQILDRVEALIAHRGGSNE